jgi:DNA-binding HxlR family transcriptional regulator
VLLIFIKQSYTFTVKTDSTYPKVSIMAAIKENSTQQLNKQLSLNACPVTYTLLKIGGRWKPLILYQLMSGVKRYGEIRKGIPGITEKMLIQHLRELETDGLIKRDVKPVVPPHVEYSLSADGLTLTPILNAMAHWGLARNQGAPGPE